MKNNNGLRNKSNFRKMAKICSNRVMNQKLSKNLFQVIRINELNCPTEVNKLIKTSWIKEFSSSNWLEGNPKLRKCAKITIMLSNDNCNKGDIIKDLLLLGQELINHIRQVIFKKTELNKDTVWLRNMALDIKATLKDRVESSSILIQENPILYILELKTLNSMLKNINNKTGFLKMVDTILNLVLNENIFPKNRELVSIFHNDKLRNLIQNDSKNRKAEISIFEFLQIYFESYLKDWYIEFTNILLKMINDSLWTIRKKIVTTIFHLSSSIPEQRYSLINALIHKFGDKEDRIASHSTFLLGELIKRKSDFNILYLIINILSTHISKNLDALHKVLNYRDKTNSYSVVYRQVYRLILFISEIKLSKHYNYYSIPSKSLTPFSNLPPPIIILKLCLSSLKVIVESKAWSNEKKNEDNIIVKEPLYRLLRVTLNCINRSLPYAEAQIQLINDNYSKELLQEFQSSYIPKLYYLCHNIQCGSIRIVILSVLYRISKILNILSDRYYRLFYSQLLYLPIYNSKNKKLFVYLMWKLINDEETNYKTSLSIMKRAIQFSIHNSDISMLLSFLIILVNIIQFNEYFCVNKLNNKCLDIKEGEERRNMKILSNITRELAIKNDKELFEEEEFFFDIESNDSEDQNSEDNLSTKESQNEILVSNNKFNKNSNSHYDPTKRDPKYANSDSTHLWEIELMKSHYHPLIVEVTHKCLLLCEQENFNENNDYKKILLRVTKFIDKFRLNYQLHVNGENNPVNKLFQLSSIPLFLQILSNNPIDINLVLLKSFDKKDINRETQRIGDFNKWNGKYIPSFLDFYKLYFEDSFVKSLKMINKESELNQDEENFDIDYDETTGRIITQKNKKFMKEKDIVLDSLIDDFTNYNDDEDQEDSIYGINEIEDLDYDGDVDIMKEVNIDDIDDLEDLDDLDNFDLDDENYLKNSKHLDNYDELYDLDNLTDSNSGLSKKKPKIVKNQLNSVTYVDADEMEQYLE